MIVKRFFLVLFLFIECEGVQLLSQNNNVGLINQEWFSWICFIRAIKTVKKEI